MTRHLIQHILAITAGASLAACATNAAPPSKPVARHSAMTSGKALHVKVPPGTTYVAPRAAPGTGYIVVVEPDTRSLQATRAELARTQQELASTRQALANKSGSLDEHTRALQQREAELLSRTEALSARERELSQRQAELDKAKAVERELAILLSGTVMFRHDEAILLPEARARLDEVAGVLKRMAPERQIAIVGHADATGTDEYNRRLSEKRADAVRSYLLQRGVAAERVVARGLGEQEPIAPNQTAEGRANNRRVEIVISPSKTPSAG
jgi:outer membrane protein OmpA-like peptidoglycan-associated protein